MPSWAVVVLVVLAVVALAAGAALFLRDRREAARSRADGPPVQRAEAHDAARVPVPRSSAEPIPYLQPDRRLLTPPPMVDDLPLRDWLVHYSPRRDQVWPSVVATFYARAAAVPEIADYFGGTDMARLQQHFARALTMLTGNGLTEGMLWRLQDAHLPVTNSHGRAITVEVYDAAVETLLAVLAEHGVPNAARAQLATTVGPLRGAIARPAPSAVAPRS
jgi:truncated hemoglobin YjbI